MPNRLFPALLLLVLSVFAAVTLTASGKAPAQLLVERTTVQVMGEIRSNQERYTDRSDELHELIYKAVFPHFDFELMGRRVLGTSWRVASTGQRDAFLIQLRLMMLHTYAAALVAYANGDVRFLEPKPGPRFNEIIVRTMVARPGAAELPISYAMRLQDEHWKVYDVSVDSVSLVAIYRASFARKVRKLGLDALIDELAERNECCDE